MKTMTRTLALALALAFPALTACLVPYPVPDGGDEGSEDDDRDDRDSTSDRDDRDDNTGGGGGGGGFDDDRDDNTGGGGGGGGGFDDDFDDEDGDVGNTCETRADCSGICLFETGDEGLGICSVRCESFADCPAFWECSEINNAAGTYCTPR